MCPAPCPCRAPPPAWPAPAVRRPAVRRIVLVRHLSTVLAPGLCYGRLDAPLGAAALAALPGLAARLVRQRPARVWSSPAARCLALARAVSEAAAVPLTVDDRLHELDFGAWEGLAWDAVPREALDRWAADPLDFRPPGGESGASLLARVAAVAVALRGTAGNGLVVSHGGPLRVLPALLGGRAPDLLAPAPALGAVLCLTVPDGPCLPGPAAASLALLLGRDPGALVPPEACPCPRCPA